MRLSALMVDAAKRLEEGSQTWNVWLGEFKQSALKTRTEMFWRTFSALIS